MKDVRYIQLNWLFGAPAALLNRDDTGLAKRMVMGSTARTRISSQCLKRRLRVADSEYALDRIESVPGSVRSRETIGVRVVEPLAASGYAKEVLDEIEASFLKVVYGKDAAERESRQPLLLGEPEISYLAKEARKIAKKHGSSVAKVQKALAVWTRDAKANIRAMREACAIPGGIVTAAFGRMVTSDPEANTVSAIHMQHAFTVHTEESEADFFAVVDDLQDPGKAAGTAHLGESELAGGLFYCYCMIDVKQLVANLGGDEETAGEVVRRLVHLIGTVTPGASHGPTAPYSYASWILIEAGDRQPCSLAEAFRTPVSPGTTANAMEALAKRLRKVDAVYGSDNVRRSVSIDEGAAMPRTEVLGTLAELADWAADACRKGRAE